MGVGENVCSQDIYSQTKIKMLEQDLSCLDQRALPERGRTESEVEYS